MKRLTPSDSVFNKLFLFNLIADKKDRATTFFEAQTKCPAVYAIVKKLNDTDIKVLIDNIENKL